MLKRRNLRQETSLKKLKSPSERLEICFETTGLGINEAETMFGINRT
jgi:hypothetical protein